MTKKTQSTASSMLNRHNSEKLQRDNTLTPNSTFKKSSNHKKAIKKPHQLTLLQKVQKLQQKNLKFFHQAQNKIDRMIHIIDQIDQKNLAQSIQNQFHPPEKPSQNLSIIPQSQNQAIDNESNSNHSNSVKSQQIHQQKESEKQLVSKTLTYLHNLLTYQRPLSHIKQQFEYFYSKLSAFSKQLQPQQPLSSDKKFLIPQNGLCFNDLRNIEQLIKEHYLRTGYFEAAEMFNRYGQEPVSTLRSCLPEQHEKRISLHKDIQKKVSKGEAPLTSDGLIEMMNSTYSAFENITKFGKNSQLKKEEKRKSKVELVQMEENFKECFTLRHQLLDHNFTEAINWCVQERLYETYENPLEYNLRLAEIKILIHEKKFRVAFEKIQKEMVKFVDNYESQINLLIGYLLFSCEWNPNTIFEGNFDQSQEISEAQNEMMQSIIKSRYQKFQISTIDINELASTFTHEYFIHYGISQFDTLEICYKVGRMYEQNYFDCIKLFSEKDREQFLKHRGHCEFDDKHNGVPHSIVLPFEIPVSPEYHYHSIFVCPVTKQVLSSNDGVEYLSCGHLVSESAKKNMAEVRRSNHKQKCPVCQKDRAADVVKVRF